MTTTDFINDVKERISKIPSNMHGNTFLNGTYKSNGINAQLKRGYMVATNNNIILHKRKYVGVWFYDIELSYNFSSLKKALEIAIYYNQNCIYDLQKNAEIYTKKYLDVTNFSNYQIKKVRKSHGFSCIRDNKAFFRSKLALHHALKNL